MHWHIYVAAVDCGGVRHAHRIHHGTLCHTDDALVARLIQEEVCLDMYVPCISSVLFLVFPRFLPDLQLTSLRINLDLL